MLAANIAYPLGLATEAGNLYVGDFIPGQIHQVAADGARVEPPQLVAEGLQGPEGLALTGCWWSNRRPIGSPASIWPAVRSEH